MYFLLGMLADVKIVCGVPLFNFPQTANFDLTRATLIIMWTLVYFDCALLNTY